TQLRHTHPDLKMVLAPRHPERFDAVQALAQRSGFTVMRRTEISRIPSPGASILLLDSIGELAALFRYAQVVFMGGSLVKAGGHNILEPARYGKPIVFGPHMENFRDISRLFLDARAAIQIGQASQLVPAISELLSSPDKAAQLGCNALSVIQQNTGAT